jgi:hypothetical protein
MFPAINKLVVRKLEQVGGASIWHVACGEQQRTKIKATVVGCGEGNARKIVGCATSILEPEEDL